MRIVDANASSLGMNVRDDSFDRVLEHPVMMLRDGGVAVLGDECRRCPLVEICGGGYLPHRYRNQSFRWPSVYCQDLTYLIKRIGRVVGRWRPGPG
jgi:radical SAM protein with 4Fe4S-binding SPASM domain